MKSLQCKGARIAYEETGTGSPVLFLHCSSATHREWLFAARRLADRHRCLLPDLMGYGETSPQFDADGGVVACRDTDVIDAMIDCAGEPADIVAHSYGAAATIEWAKSRPEAVRSLLLVEPVAFQLLNNESYRAEWRKVSTLADRVIDACNANDHRRAARRYMSFWIGRLRWMLAPRRFRRSVIRTMDKVAFEFSQIYHLPGSPDPLCELDFPVTFVTGSRTRREAKAVTAILCDVLPRSSSVTIDGAGHMSPFTHPQQILAYVDNHLAGQSQSFTARN